MEETVKILLCEDDENLGMLLREYLQTKGFATTLCPDGEAGFKEFTKNKYDIAVLDVMMPKKDGFTLAQEIRQQTADLPIVFLTAKTLKEDILEGFKIGADDYITKPFSMEELVFRVEAILRRVRGKKTKESTMYHIGKFTFDTQKQLLKSCKLYKALESYLWKKRKGISLQKTYPFFSFISESSYLKHHVQVPFLIPSSANRQIRQCQPG